jgi:microsomal dipeptidase-like Zn-dependent dipeptidase
MNISSKKQYHNGPLMNGQLSKKIKPILIILLLLLLLGTFLARIFLPNLIDSRMNKVVVSPPYSFDQRALALYQSLDFVSDLHSDVLLWRRDITERHHHGHQDIPRMIESNIALQGFTLVNKVPKGLNFDSNDSETDQLTPLFVLQGRAPTSWFSLTERILVQIEELNQYSVQSEGKLKVIKSKIDLTSYLKSRKENPDMTAAFIGIEGAHALEGDIKNLDIVFDAGVRMIGLTHFFDNEVGGSAHGKNKAGITDFGRLLIKEMEHRQIFVDLSHASPQLIDDVLAIATKPILVSHTGIKGTCNNVRNLSDSQLKRIATLGGVIGIAMFEKAVCGNSAKDIARAIQYTANLVGVEHVGLGSDFDGAVTTPFDVTGLPSIVSELLKLGISRDDIKLIMGQNIKRVMLENLPD